MLFTPELHGSRTDFRSLMRQDYVPRRCMHEVDNPPCLYIKASAEWRIDLGDNHYVVAVQNPSCALWVGIPGPA